MEGTSCVAVVDEVLSNRTQIFRNLKENLKNVQLRMENQANAKRKDMEFQPDDWVFLKLQPFRQFSQHSQHSHKLSKHFFFWVIQNHRVHWSSCISIGVTSHCPTP